MLWGEPYALKTLRRFQPHQQLIGMGPVVVPLILEELRREPEFWFWALEAITNEQPVPPESIGHMESSASWVKHPPTATSRSDDSPESDDNATDTIREVTTSFRSHRSTDLTPASVSS